MPELAPVTMAVLPVRLILGGGGDTGMKRPTGMVLCFEETKKKVPSVRAESNKTFGRLRALEIVFPSASSVERVICSWKKVVYITSQAANARKATLISRWFLMMSRGPTTNAQPPYQWLPKVMRPGPQKSKTTATIDLGRRIVEATYPSSTARH